MPLPDDTEKTIVVRDRRKPNQYTTDNLIAREWLPILTAMVLSTFVVMAATGYVTQMLMEKDEDGEGGDD